MDKVVHTPLHPEEQERLKRLQEEVEGRELTVLIERIQRQFELSVNQIAVAAGMDESALHKIIKGENREFKAEHVDRLLDYLEQQGKLKDINEITVWKRALRVSAFLHFEIYKAIESRLRQIEDPVKRVESLKEYLNKQYPVLAETYDKTGGAFPAFLPLLDVIARELDNRWGWIRVPSGYRLNTVRGNHYTLSSTDLFPKKITDLGSEFEVEDTGFGTYTIKKHVAQPKLIQTKVCDATDSALLVLGGMEFMRVPAGKFIMGSNNGDDYDDDYYDDAKPQHTIDIPYDYWMARFPVTNDQYNMYVKTKGIDHPVSDWQKKKDHPVVEVSWNTAMEYCNWLNNLLKDQLPSGMIVRLPTEAEWEKAARGPSTGSEDGREYPWGNTFDKNKCNSSEGGKDVTTPIGMYSPQGELSYGCADMAGNVWEWTHSEYKAYPYNAMDGREDEQKNVPRVLRGGALIIDVQFTFRNWYYSDDRNNNYIGFRVVVASPL